MLMLRAEQKLSEYLSARGISYTPADAGRGQVIDRFEFGERYLVKMAIGRSFDIPDLEDILWIMRAEFLGGWVPVIELARDKGRPSAYDPMGQRGEIMLVVRSPAKGMPRIECRNMDMYTNHVRRLVTMYNLTQNWDHFYQGKF